MTKQIWERKTTEIIQLLKSITSPDKASLILTKDLRGKLFALEGVARLYLKSPHKQLIAKEVLALQDALNKIKVMEDRLGKFALAHEAEEYHGKDAKITKHINLANKAVVSDIKIQDWQSTLLEIKDAVLEIEFPKNELKTFKNNLEAEISRTRKKIHKLVPIVNLEKYDYESLEAGVHEWRRSIRWISIMIQAYKEECELIPKKLKGHKKLVKSYQDSPFAQLGKGKVKIDTLAYYELSDFIKRIGEVKSQGEIAFYFSKNLWDIKPERIEKPSQDLLKEWLKCDVLSRLVK